MDFKNIVLLLLVSIIMSSCALWPYKKDFDCPIQEGLKCKSLYEISEMADKGLFGPHATREEVTICPCGKKKKSGIKSNVKFNELEDLEGRCHAS